MSYIHDALKKAQQEKRRVVAQCSNRWADRHEGKVARPQWLAPLLVVCIAVGFSAYSWISSIDQLSGGKGTDGGARIHRAIITPPSPMPSPIHKSPTKPSPRAQRPTMPREPAQTVAAVGKADRDVEDETAAPSKRPVKKASPAAESPVSAPEPVPPEEISYARALAYQKAGDLTKAKRIYEALLQQSPRVVSALNNLGTIYMQEDNPARARVFFEKAIRIDPTFVDPFYNLACLHGTQKDVKRSLFYLKKAVSLDEAARKWAKADKDLKNLRGHREYEEIVNGA